MTIKIGDQNISKIQKKYLSDAKKTPTSLIARQMLLQVADDSDITSGRETMHPDWGHIFRRNIKQLKSELPSEAYTELVSVLGRSDPYDAAALAIDPSAVHIAFLLGAGASKPAPSDIPTVTELLPDLLERARRLNRPDLERLADFCDESNISNIEDLLTAAQLSEFCSRNPTVLRLIEFLIYRKGEREPEIRMHRLGLQSPAEDLSALAFLQDTLQVLFGLLSSRMLPAKPNAAHKAIASYVQKHPNTSIVTTNYDCCMDLALGAEEKDFTYLVDFHNRERSATPPKCSLIKLHGSLNWFYCDTCQHVQLIDIKKTVKEYLADQNCYSIIAVCKDCGGQRRGLLVPPLIMKFDLAPSLTPLIEKAQEAFNRADVIVAVGFSFADADLYITRMVTKPLQLSSTVTLFVFDPDYDVVERLRKQLSLRIPGFNAERVVRIAYDCSEALPAFLSGKLEKLSGLRTAARTKASNSRRRRVASKTPGRKTTSKRRSKARS